MQKKKKKKKLYFKEKRETTNVFGYNVDFLKNIYTLFSIFFLHGFPILQPSSGKEWLFPHIIKRN